MIPLFGPDMLADPYAAYAALRERDPVYWSAQLDAWVLTRYADVDEVLRDQRFSSTFTDAAPEPTTDCDPLSSLYAFVHSSLVFSDPPEHTRLRRLVSRAFTPRAVEGLTDAIWSITRQLVGELPSGGRLDVVADLAEPLPMIVLGQLLGVTLGEADRHQLKGWCDDFLLPFGRDLTSLDAAEQARTRAASDGLVDFVATVLDRRGDRLTALPGDDVVSRLLAGEADDRLSRQELFANIVLFLIAGHENTTSLIANGTAVLLERPAVRAALAAEPGRWPDAVRELLRLVTPNQFIRRRALTEVHIDGRTIQAEDAVMLVLAAANRDPARFPDPDRFDLDRPDEWNVALGHGYHYCIGGPLARLETGIALRCLFERYPQMQRMDCPPEYVPNFNVRMLRALPVTV